MFAFKFQGVASWTLKARTLARATVPNAFDALREAARAAFARQASRHTPATPSNATPTRFDASSIPTTPTPHPSGTAIVASVGLAFPPPTNAVHNLLLHHIKGAVPSTSPVVPPSKDVHVAFDLTIDDQRPQCDAPAHSSHRSTSRSSSTSPTPLGCHKVDVGVQVSTPSPGHSPHSSSSSDSDLPVECLTPLATNGECHSHRKAEALRSLLPFEAPLPFDIDGARGVDEYILEFDECSARRQDLYEDLAERAIAFHYLCADPVEDDDMPTAFSGPIHGSSSTISVVSPTSNAALEFPESEPSDGEHPDIDTDTNSSDDPANQTVDTDDDDDEEPQIPLVLYHRYTKTRYRIDGIIGCGGFARVLQATKDSGECVAIKVTHKREAYAKSPYIHDLLCHEMDTLRWATTHACPGLTKLIESWEDEDNIYFVMVRSPAYLAMTSSNLI